MHPALEAKQCFDKTPAGPDPHFRDVERWRVLQ